jgi:hypothetical protein
MEMLVNRHFLIVALVASCAGRAFGQTVIHRFIGTQSQQGFAVCASAGDVNGDGRQDIIVGGPGYSTNELVRVFSGASGAILYDLTGSFPNIDFGSGTAGLGDLNGDGRSEFAIAAAEESLTLAAQGVIRVYSGIDGSVLYTFMGDANPDRLGTSMEPAGDVDADGKMDLIAGFPGSGLVGQYAGGARVYSGATGAVLWTFYGAQHHAGFGLSVNGAGDVDADGHADVIVGAWNGFLTGLIPRGYAIVYSGATGAPLYSLEGDSYDDRFGSSVAGLGDVNGDGHADFAVGAEDDDNNGSNSGSVRVFSGATGLPLYTIDGPEAGVHYSAMTGGVDLDNDGLSDVLVGSPLEASGAGRVHLRRGYDGALITTWTDAMSGGGFGARVRIAGDTNLDGYTDFLVGSSSGEGQTLVISGFDCQISNYCVLSPNSVGPGAQIGWSGSPSIMQNSFTLRATGVGMATTGIFFYGHNPAQTPFGNGVRCIGGQIFRLSVVHAIQGVLTYSMDFTHPPSPAGQILGGSHWRFQAWFRDALGPAFFNLSDGLDVVFCP